MNEDNVKQHAVRRSLPATSASNPAADAATAVVGSAIVAEFNALRLEITDLERHEKLSLQLALTLLVAIIAATVAISGGTVNRLVAVGAAPLILAAIAVIFCLLACHAIHAELRIALAARYVNDELRPQFRDLTGVDVWRWETYLHKQRQRTESARHANRLIRVLDYTRWLVYLLPMAACLATFAVLPTLRTVPTWQFSAGIICLAVAATVSIVAASKPGFTILR